MNLVQRVTIEAHRHKMQTGHDPSTVKIGRTEQTELDALFEVMSSRGEIVIDPKCAGRRVFMGMEVENSSEPSLIEVR